MGAKIETLLDEALKIYGIPKEHVFSSKVYEETKEVVIVTNGGKKLRHRKGDPAKVKLSEVDITGILPDEPMIWSRRFNQWVKIKDLPQEEERLWSEKLNQWLNRKDMGVEK